jgi:hypothetical protein
MAETRRKEAATSTSSPGSDAASTRAKSSPHAVGTMAFSGSSELGLPHMAVVLPLPTPPKERTP